MRKAHFTEECIVTLAMIVALAAVARADRQAIAPGTGLQGAVVVDSGANGICETTAVRDDVQAAGVGHGAPFENAVRCGPNMVADSAAVGDDTQLVAVGSACDGAGNAVVDTGPDGIANSPAAADDVQIISVGTALPNRACVVTGANGIADTDLVAGDDMKLLLKGAAQTNTIVIRCGPNHVAETSANNARPGDDVQLVGVGAPCAGDNTPIVDSGANGIAETRAQGVDLVLALPNPRPAKLTIRRRRASASRRVKLVVLNREFGATAPGSRLYALAVSDGSCPRGTVSQVDADARADGLQATAAVPLRGKTKGSFVVTLRLDDVTSVDSAIPFRCTVNVAANAVDAAPDADDAANPGNNAARVDVLAVDRNDL
jgi:hypothetical protein